MKRKVAQIGPSTLMVSLPTKWVKENGIKKGDEMEVVIDGQNINYSLNEIKNVGKEIELDISGFGRHKLSRYLESLYITDHDMIILTHKNKVIWDTKNKKQLDLKHFIKKLSDRFIGMEIVSQTNNSTTLKCFLIEKEQKLEVIEKRIFFLFKEAIQESLNSIENKEHKEFNNIAYDYHDNIVKFITYYLRSLNSSNKTNEEKNQLYSLYMMVDKMIDKFRHVNEKIEKYGCSKKVKKTLIEVYELLYEQFNCLYRTNFSQDLIEQRDKVIKSIEKTQYTIEEFRIISELNFFIHTLNDFSRAIIIKELN